MSDMVEMYREQREFTRDRRAHWHECPSEGCQFGGNPVKVAPAGKCRHCGWIAPGERGSDIAAARNTAKEREDQHAAELADKAARQADRTCEFCKRVFPHARAMRQHRAMYHAKRVAKMERERGVSARV